MGTLISHDPRTGEVVGAVLESTPDEVAAAVATARKAFPEWAGLGHRGRRPHLLALKRALVARADEIADLVSRETGKTPEDALLTELSTAGAITDYVIRKAGKTLGTERRSSFPFLIARAWVEYHPYGVAGVISPWNYPFVLPYHAMVTALAAGCTVVVKPSEVTPLTGALLEDLAAGAGLPAGVVQVVHGGPESGAALVEHADVVSFTGSPKTARAVAAEAAKHLTPVTYELGGKDAMIVLEDADARRAARAAVWGGLLNAGQTCIAVERVYVVDDIYDEFLAHVRDEFATMNAGAGGPSDIGPLTFPPQLDIVAAQVADAVAKGATVLHGGARARPDRDYWEPTLLVDVDHTMAVMTEETFGPVLPVMRVRNEEAALELANDTPYGLHGSVWTGDRRRGERIASAMHTGTVAINDALINFGMVDLPFGGIGESGHGSRNGPEGLRSFCYPKAVTRRRFPMPRELWWFPRRGGRRFWKAFLRLAARR